MKFYKPQIKKEKYRKLLLNKKFFIIGGVIFILVLIFAIAYGARNADFLKIKKISISGLQSISADKLSNDLRNFFSENSKISNFLGADNILAWKTGANDFLKDYPALKNLKITKKYFKREIAIEAEERNKFGIWCVQAQKDAELMQNNTEEEAINNVEEIQAQNDAEREGMRENQKNKLTTNKCGWFDESGILFAEAPIIETEILNKVSDYSGRSVTIGSALLPDNLMVNLIAIFDIFNKSNFNTKTVYFSDLDLEEVEVKAAALTPKIYFSLRFDSKFSLAVINSLKKSGEWEKLNYVDFRVENRAYYR